MVDESQKGESSRIKGPFANALRQICLTWYVEFVCPGSTDQAKQLDTVLTDAQLAFLLLLSNILIKYVQAILHQFLDDLATKEDLSKSYVLANYNECVRYWNSDLKWDIIGAEYLKHSLHVFLN